MGRRYINVEFSESVYLYDFDTKDLCDEISERYESANEKKRQEIISKLDFSAGKPIVSDRSLLDTLKMEIAEKGIQSKSIDELEEFFK